MDNINSTSPTFNAAFHIIKKDGTLPHAYIQYQTLRLLVLRQVALILRWLTAHQRLLWRMVLQIKFQPV